MIAKIIGFAKSVIQASYFGATIETDSYNLASGIVSNVLYMLTTALAVSFVPIYIQKKSKMGKQKAFEFASNVITVLLAGAVVLVVIFELVAPLVMKLVAPAYTGKILADSILYFRVLVVGYVFALVAALYQNLLDAEKIYGFSSFTSIVNSVVLIVVILLGASKIGIWALVISLPLSYFFQFLLLYVKGRRYGILAFRCNMRDETIRLMCLQGLPILLSQATVEINQVIDRSLLSTMEEGVVTAVSYAAVLYQFVVHIISIPISTVMFTELSQAGAEENIQYIQSALKAVIKVIILICIPIIIVVFLCSTDIVQFVYGRGNFGKHAVEKTALGLIIYIICLIPVTIKSVLTKAYYALNDTRRPMFLGILEVAMNITLSIMLAKKWGLVGVVGATAISSLIVVIVMILNFSKTYVCIITNVFKEYWKIVIATSLTMGNAYFLKGIAITNVMGTLIIKTISIFAVYLGGLIITKDEMILECVNVIKRRIKKTNHIN